MRLSQLIKYIERSLSGVEKELKEHVITEFGIDIPYKKLNIKDAEVIITLPVKPEEIAKGIVSLKLKPILKVNREGNGSS